MIEISLFVSHGQLAIFCCGLENPFNDWTDKHVDQGFSWRSGSVSFRSLTASGDHCISVAVVDYLALLDEMVVRAVEVPFDVPKDGCIEVASVSGSSVLSIESGAYLLRCELLPEDPDGSQKARLVFSRNDKPHFAVTRVDPELKLDGELLTSAQPAL